MSLQNVENLENNMAKLTIEVSAETVEKALDTAYQKQKNKISVPGFRKGKVPRKMVEQMYGAGIFYEDAANEMIPEAYTEAALESKLEIVANPDIAIVQIEKGKPFIFTAEVVLKPEVTLGTYTEIEVAKKEAEATEEELQEELDKVRQQNARIVTVDDRPVEQGDDTVIDFEGFVDGVAFEGGKATDYPLTIGSHSFIDTFEDQLIGKSIGEETEVNVTFPEEYHEESLKGKPALFKVTVKEIKKKELPELDDDFAQDVSEFDTMEEYKEDLKKQIKEKKQQTLKTEKENEVIDKIIENSKMDVPEKMIQAQVQNMMNDFAQRLQAQGLSMEQYMQFTGMTAETLTEQMQPQALKRIQSRLVLEAIAKAEQIQVSEEEYEAEIEKMAAMYQMEKDKLMEMIGETEKENITSDMAVQKAVDFVVNSAKEV